MEIGTEQIWFYPVLFLFSVYMDRQLNKQTNKPNTKPQKKKEKKYLFTVFSFKPSMEPNPNLVPPKTSAVTWMYNSPQVPF